eukprot:CAMPEP_0196585098 /NCGR_PEP_ID=MMETSP1081-20130531/49521_1 /TAXON_ID=36882 /ORGANISM="Pyramimonas amylifera, Strain CCMP720" /LENGTH=223 /DNA_ID=CAMNT_0041906531 /DNA_START=181 /DNA_END=852 /DNA_ORIENTATION=-
MYPTCPPARPLALSVLGFTTLAVGPLLESAWAQGLPTEVFEVADLGLDTGVQLVYLGALLALLFTGAALVVRQVLVKRELEEAAKNAGERVRSGQASGEDLFELGVLLLRKKSYSQAIKNLESAVKVWDGEPEELAQAHNALGFALFSQDKYQASVEAYRKACELQPGYVTAWNNLGNSYEKLKKSELALEAYEETLSYEADNDVALQRVEMLSTRLGRLRQK